VLKFIFEIIVRQGSKQTVKHILREFFGGTFILLPIVFCVIVAVTAALVWAICHWSESKDVKQLREIGAVKVKKSFNRINYSIMFYLTSYLAIFPVLLVFGDRILAVLTSVAWALSFGIVTLLLWKEIPKNIARVTPKKAAGFCYIPLFNYYWWFIAFRGLADDVNKTAIRYGHPAFVDLNFATAVYVIWVASAVSGFLDAQELILLVNLAAIIMTFVFFVLLRNAMAKLLLLKTTLPPVAASSQEC